MNVLANLISFFHILVILFILIAPFTNTPYLWILHVAFGVSLLVHWIGNNNMCSLSVFESQLRGLDYTESFTHKFVAPMYDVSKSTWSTICYIIVVILTSISIYKIYNSDRVYSSLKCFSESLEPFYKKFNGCMNILM
jgi:hypothetical protein